MEHVWKWLRKAAVIHGGAGGLANMLTGKKMEKFKTETETKMLQKYCTSKSRTII